MAEDTWMRCEREFFIKSSKSIVGVPEKTVNKILEEYNRFLQKDLLGDSPYVAEDLKLTILKARGEIDPK